LFFRIVEQLAEPAPVVLKTKTARIYFSDHNFENFKVKVHVYDLFLICF
jgi:hypothetical protein